LFLLRRPKGDVVDLDHTPLLLRPCGLTLRAVGILNRLRHSKAGERRGRQQKHEPHLAAEVRLREQRLASGQAVLLDWVRRRHRHLQQIRHLVAFDHERIPRRVVRVRRAVDNVMLQIARERQSAVSLAQSDAVAGDLKHLVAAGCLEQDLGHAAQRVEHAVLKHLAAQRAVDVDGVGKPEQCRGVRHRHAAEHLVANVIRREHEHDADLGGLGHHQRDSVHVARRSA
jgi:hypothetical protein